MGKTKIEWAEAVWNPVSGCSKVSEGCRHCYAERMAKRLAGRAGYPKKNPFAVTLHYDRLAEPLVWRRPRRVFVCSMSDLFHPSVPDRFIGAVWFAMLNAPQPGHVFMVLTKRPERMAELTGPRPGGEVMLPLLPNVWLGTSVEDQAAVDERIPHLLRCPAAIHFVSYEPALGPVDFMHIDGAVEGYPGITLDVLHGGGTRCFPASPWGLKWIIAGGESGPKARPAHPDWFRSLRDQCQAAGVPFFFKQWGEWHPAPVRADSFSFEGLEKYHVWDRENVSRRIGKKAAGRLLDGREHSEYPGEARP